MAEALPVLNQALADLEAVWLKHGSPFLAGRAQPSIADLLLSQELEQLRLLSAPLHGHSMEALLGPHPVARAWLQRVADYSPQEYAAVTDMLVRAAAAIAAGRSMKSAPSGQSAEHAAGRGASKL